MLRLWLLRSSACSRSHELYHWLKELQLANTGLLSLVGSSEWSAPLPTAVRSGQADVIVCRLAHSEEEMATALLAGLPLPTLFVLDTPLRSPHRLLQVVKQSACVPFHAGPEALYAALLSLHVALERQAELTREVERLRQQQQQRLIVEKAKALLIQRQGWSEEQAYHHLRRLARRQRRRITEIAAAVLQTTSTPGTAPRPDQ
ncbi:MAG: ANTAR domain-containing protein [Gemmatales bacterium]|nr:ANTAR domain-containing protein [Gemmatales bacterium]